MRRAPLACFVILFAVGCGATDNVIGRLVGGDLPGAGSSSSGGADPSSETAGSAGTTGGAAGQRTTNPLEAPPAGRLGDAGAISIDDDVSASSNAGAAGSSAVDDSNSDCIIRVTTEGSDSNGGSSFGSALRTVQAGLARANSLIARSACLSVEIWVAAGTYLPTTGTDRTKSFQLVPSVALYGGFVGNELARAERNIAFNVTTLSGEIGTPDWSDNSLHVVSGATGATLDGFTITGGYTNEIPYIGAGMYNVSASPTVTNCAFDGNVANAGSGMYNDSSSPIVTSCSFSNNSAQFGNGAGMYNKASSPIVSDCTFTDNAAQYSGAGIYNSYSTLVISNSKFTGNSASDGGGGMVSINSTVTITRSVFVSNYGYVGGGMINTDSSITLTDCTFTGNSGYIGGGMYNDTSSLMVTNGIFAGNVVSGNAKFTGEYAASGGAIFNDASSPILTNCTFTGNTASYSGGALHNENSSAPIVTNSIFWADAVGASVSEIVDSDATSASTLSHNIVQGGYASGVGIGSADPLFVDAANGNFNLKAGSPAIDAGNGCASFVALADQAGNSRWDIESMPNTSNALDIGALEYQGTAGVDAFVTAFVCP